MRYLPKLLPALALFLFLLMPADARADTVVIVGGSFTPRPHLGGPFNLTGQGLTFSGGTGIGVSGVSCFACAGGSLVNLRNFNNGSDYSPGPAIVNGVSYQQLFYAGSMEFTSSFVLPSGNSPFTITVPFNFNGSMNGYLRSPFAGDPGPAVFSTTLLGQGWATLQFGVQPVPGGNHFYLAGIRYDFNSPTAVPEPATLLLLGTGLAGVAARYRRRSRRQ